MKPAGVVHYIIGQRYPSIREDGKRVDMVAIACTGTRVFLPRGHTGTHSTKITCKTCIEKLVENMQEQIDELKLNLETAVENKTVFKITMREKRNEHLRKFYSAPAVDPEILMRVGAE